MTPNSALCSTTCVLRERWGHTPGGVTVLGTNRGPESFSDRREKAGL